MPTKLSSPITRVGRASRATISSFIPASYLSERAGEHGIKSDLKDQSRSRRGICVEIRWCVRHVGSSTIKATHGFRSPQFARSARGPAQAPEKLTAQLLASKGCGRMLSAMRGTHSIWSCRQPSCRRNSHRHRRPAPLIAPTRTSS